MINSIPQIEPHKNNPFDMVSQRTSNGAYWIDSRRWGNNQNEQNEQTLVGSESYDKMILTPKQARKTNNAMIIGLSIAGATIFAAGLIFILLSGGPKGLSRGIQKLKLHYEKKYQQAKLSGTGANYSHILAKIEQYQRKAEAINNGTTIKDFIFKKIMYGPNNNWNFTRKIHSGITDLFEKFGLKTVIKSYQKTSNKFDKLQVLNETVTEELIKSLRDNSSLTINGKTKTKKEWIEYINTSGKEVLKIYRDNFNETMRNSRYLRIKKFTKELEQNFEKQGPFWFWSKDTFSSFVAESKILPRKLQMQNDIKGIRQLISYSKKDLYKEADNIIMKISSGLSVQDKDALKQLNIIRENFKLMSRNGFVDNQKMQKDMSNFKEIILKSSEGKEKGLNGIIDNFTDLKDLYDTYKQGKFQDILEIYEKLLPKDKFSQVEKTYKSVIGDLDKSIKIETEDFINKLRDLTMGSAPTDLLTVLGGFATLTYYLSKSENNQERAAIALKYGIPALAGIGVSLYGNARLFAGTKSMILGIVSSVIVGKIGSIANNYLVDYLKKNDKYVEIKQNS